MEISTDINQVPSNSQGHVCINCKGKISSTVKYAKCAFTHGKRTKCTIVLPVCEKCEKKLPWKIAFSKSLSSVIFFLIISAIAFAIVFLVFLVFKQTWGIFLLTVVVWSFISMLKEIYTAFSEYNNSLTLSNIWSICMEQGAIPKENILEIESINPQLMTPQGDIMLKGEGNFKVKVM